MEFKNGRERVEYIWDYYKVPIVGILTAILLFFLMDIPSLWAKPKTIWNAYYINSTLTSEEAEALVAGFRDDFLDDQEESHEYYLDTGVIFSLDEFSPGSYEQMARMTAVNAAQDLDVVFGEEVVLAHYAKLGGFLDLEEVLTPAEMAQWEEHLLYLPDEDGEQKAYAFNLTDTALANGVHYQGEEIYGALMRNSERQPVSRQFLMYLLSAPSREQSGKD